MPARSRSSRIISSSLAPTQVDISNKPVAHDRIDVSFNEHASLMQHRHGLPNHLYKIHVVLDYHQRVMRALGKAAKGALNVR
jgi:hypothetical protein